MRDVPTVFGEPARAGFVIDALRPGAGTENQLLILLRGLDRSRVLPFVCCIRDDGNVAPADVGCPVDVIGIPKIASAGGVLGILRVARWVRAHRLGHVVTFFRDANIVGTLAARLAGATVVSSRRNIGRGYWHDATELRVLRALNRLTALHVANSDAVRDYTVASEGVDPSRILVIPNAIDLGRFRVEVDAAARTARRAALGLPDRFLVGCVANLRPIKGVDVLVEAFHAFGSSERDATLVLVGEGPEEPRLRSLASRLGIGDRIQFMGSRDDIPDVLSVLDVAVLPSRGEGSPNAVLEYMAAGLPIVATDVGGVPELLESGRHGTLVPPEDPESLAGALIHLYAHPADRQAFAHAAHARVEREFPPGVAVDRWTRLLAGSLGSPERG